MSSGSRFRGHGAAGHEQTQAFRRALRQVYDKAVGASSDDPRYVRNPRDGRVVGILRRQLGVLVFQREVIESKHRLRMFDGAWALETGLIKELERREVRWVCLVTDSGRRLYAPLCRFRERGHTIMLGHGLQLALAERHFADYVDEQEDGNVEDPEPVPVRPVQPSLFGEAAHANCIA